ncbi:hypothetical protein [Paenibacillus odorifer]|uniref:hypothetical protein n=1 Tax=Paenibacillus odorifer TaxID=189426 RepID=UPI00096DCC4E|nr:hypothetical protein [Paenibacillus odorifer]OMD66778.1 hypothetical protein BSK50_30650 [Paenibacillus odorifer]
MEALLYIILSMFDGLAIFIFAFGTFKINLKDYWKEIVFTSAIISTGTYFMNEHEAFSSFTPFICLVFLTASLLLYFRISIFSSIRVALVGFVAQIVIQGLFVLICTKLFQIDLSDIQGNRMLGGSIQVISDGTLIGISLMLRKNKRYFTTLPYDYSYYIKFSKINIIILIGSLVVLVMTYNMFNFNNIYVEIVFWLICFINIILFEYVKEARSEID